MWKTWKNLHEKFHERIEEMQKSRGLRIWILHILDEHGPKNGVEIMDAVQTHQETLHHLNHRGHRHSKRPSPGSVYPMLKKMVAENLIIKREDGRYELTEKGHDIVYTIFGHFHGRHRKNTDLGTFAIENALTEIDGYVSNFEDIKKEKLIPHEELIRNLSERLKNINESLHEE
ncbi:MAG: PadR family transcriptional regulator [Methanobacterium sp.]